MNADNKQKQPSGLFGFSRTGRERSCLMLPPPEAASSSVEKSLPDFLEKLRQGTTVVSH
jgi:hypothetical protein